MPGYEITVIATIALTTLIIIYVLHRMKRLNMQFVIPVAVCCVIVAFSTPLLFKCLLSYFGSSSEMPQSLLIPAIVSSYLAITFILSILVTAIIPKKVLEPSTSGVNEPTSDNNPQNQDLNLKDVVNNINPDTNTNYIEELFNRQIAENVEITPEAYMDITELENNFEKSVDSAENIDKMGLEVLMQDFSAQRKVEDCIEEAFRLKNLGDYEGAILHFMYALDRNPSRDLVFLIVLDICVLYKALGQIELAKDILLNYFYNYKDLMNPGIKDEIEKNLVSNEA